MANTIRLNGDKITVPVVLGAFVPAGTVKYNGCVPSKQNPGTWICEFLYNENGWSDDGTPKDEPAEVL